MKLIITALTLFMICAITVHAQNRAYITNFFSNDVSVINTNTDQVVATVPVGNGPGGVEVQPFIVNFAYVANQDDGTVSVIRISE